MHEKIRKLKGGKISRQRFEKLLGLSFDNENRQYYISNVLFRNKQIEIEIHKDEEFSGTLFLKNNSVSDEQSSGKDIDFTFSFAQPAVIEGLLKKTLPARLDGIKLKSLINMLLSDPDSELKKTNDARIESVQSNWGKDTQWRIFFSDAEMKNASVVSFIDFMSGGDRVRIAHTDHECDQISLTRFTFFNYMRRFWSEDLETGSREQIFSTDLNELDAVMGSTTKLESLLDSIQEKCRGKNVTFVNCCVPMLTGDDIMPALDNFKEKTGCHMVFLDQALNSAVEPYMESLKKVTDSPEFRNRTAQPDMINLVGFEKDKSFLELVDILKETGIRINNIIIPALDYEKFGSYLDASYQVFRPAEPVDRIFNLLFKDIQIKTIKLAAPFGYENSLNWFREIAREVGFYQQCEKVLDRLIGVYSDDIERMKARAEKYRVAVILDIFQVESFYNTGVTFGVEIASILEEMGFGIDFFIFSESRAACDGRKKFITDRMIHRERHTIERFTSRAELNRILENPSFDTVYSDYYYDKRLSRNGLSQFDVSFFEKGIAGYSRSLERMLNACELPFYKKYAAYYRSMNSNE